jgi:hypothetical protein
MAPSPMGVARVGRPHHKWNPCVRGDRRDQSAAIGGDDDHAEEKVGA